MRDITHENKKRQIPHVQIGVCCYFFWFLLFSTFHPSPLVDEIIHQEAIFKIFHGQFDTPNLPMLPGYHWIIVIFSVLSEPSLCQSRFFTFLISTFSLPLYASLLWHNNKAQGRYSLYLLTFLPILLPYTAMVYTDAVGLFFIIAAIWSQTKRYYILSAILGFSACLVRQSFIVWVAFIIVWNIIEVWDQYQTESKLYMSWLDALVRRFLPKITGHLIAIFCICIILLIQGSLLGSPIVLNYPQPNISNMYTLGFLVLLLWLPIWIENFQGNARLLIDAAIAKPIQIGVSILCLGVLGSILVATYHNWHPWNQDMFFLGNIPLVLMNTYPFFRVLGVLLIFIAFWFIARFWSIQPNRRYLIILASFTVFYLSFHSSVDPRYFIIPFVLADFFHSYTIAQETALAIWYFFISTFVSILILFNRALW